MPQAAADKIRVLVVDDHEDNAFVVGKIFELAGFEVRIASSGEIAIGSCFNFRPQAVLLDLNIPGVDVFEVCRRLRKMPAGEAILILILSGYLQDEHREKALGAGATYCFMKPTAAGELLIAIRRHFAA